MGETRKLAAILVSDVVGYSRLTGANEDRILARLRALRSDLIDPTVAVHHGRVVKRTGDASMIEFRSVVDAVNCAIEVQNAMVERNAGVPEDRRIVFRPPSPHRRREIIQGAGERPSTMRPMRTKARAFLIDALRDAHHWLDDLTRSPNQTIEALAAREGKTERWIRRTLSLAFL